jgi:hypothetical protein
LSGSSGRAVHVSRSADAVELYFPPLRMPEVAIPFALFGAICAGIPGVLIAALVPAAGADADASGLLSAALISGFVLPFAAFGAVFILLAVYMVANALHVRADVTSISTARLICGVIVKRRHIARADIASIDAEIASRYQSVFSSRPVYQIVIRGRNRERVIAGETLRGEAEMEYIRALIDNPAAAGGSTRDE